MTAWSAPDAILEDRTAFARPQARRTLAACIGVLAASLLWRLHFGTIPDTSWIITMCEAVLGGKRLYVDIIETNPPFSLWLFMPAVWLAQKLGLAAETVVNAYVCAVTAAGLGLAALVVAKAGLKEEPRLVAWFPAVLALFLLLPGNAFTEREHLGTALFLPLLALMAWRAGNAPSRPGLLLAVSAGLAGSVLLLVKPYYAVAVLCPALWVAWRRRSLLCLLAPEYWTILAVCLLYLAAVMRLHPEFLESIYPLLADTYMRIGSWQPSLNLYGFPFALLAAAFILRARRDGCSDIAAIGFLAAAASLIPLFYQGKGWPYHAFPALALLCLALMCLHARPTANAAGKTGGVLETTALCLGLASAWLPFTLSEKPDARLVSAIREATVAPRVALFGSSIADGNPLTRMVGGRWTSAYCSDWLGAFAMSLAERAAAGDRQTDAARYQARLETYVAEKRREFAAQRPDIVLLNRNDAFWVEPLLDRYGFAGELTGYRLLAEADGLAVYLRKDYRRPGAG